MEFLMIFLMHKIDVSWVRRLRYKEKRDGSFDVLLTVRPLPSTCVLLKENRDGSFDVIF